MRITVAAALALGYVLGSRAGRGRYEQIREAASRAAKRLEDYGSTGSLATAIDQGGHWNGAGSGRAG